jgi:predicted  nucleic acid-binding Zn-ribbon protein
MRIGCRRGQEDHGKTVAPNHPARPSEEFPVHIVTKILMVFCAVLSLLLAALTMAYASNANALKSSINAERNSAAAYKATQSAQLAEHANEMTNQTARLTAIENTLRQKEVEVANLQKERTDLSARVQQAEADANSIRNQISQAAATVQTQAKLIDSYRTEVTALRDSMLGTEKRNIELTDKINDLASAREVLEQNARALKEQLEETKLNLQAAQSSAGSVGAGVANMSSKAPVRELPGPLVRAGVTEVFKSASGDDMVVINEGSNRGLKEGVLMNVVRGDAFVATIVLKTIEPTRSVGRVTTTRSSVVQTGDTVLSRLD